MLMAVVTTVLSLQKRVRQDRGDEQNEGVALEPPAHVGQDQRGGAGVP